MFSQKRFSQASLLIFTKYLQNRITMFCPGIMIYCGYCMYRYQMQAFNCQHRKRDISKRNYKITVVQEIHISRLELQRWSLEFVISFSKVETVFGIWD
jgi:hypothetical protein